MSIINTKFCTLQHTHLCSHTTFTHCQEAKNMFKAIIRQTVDVKHSVCIEQMQQGIPITGSSVEEAVPIDTV